MLSKYYVKTPVCLKINIFHFPFALIKTPHLYRNSKSSELNELAWKLSDAVLIHVDGKLLKRNDYQANEFR